MAALLSFRKTFFRLVPILAIFLSAAGLNLCLFLLSAYRGEFCPANAGCGNVLHSRFGIIAGVPLPVFGAVFYGALLGLFLIILGLRKAVQRKRVFTAAQFLILVGTITSAVLMYVQFRVLRSFCPLCTGSAAIMVLLCILATFDLSPQRLGDNMHAVGYLLLAALSTGVLVAIRALDRPPGSEVVLRIDNETFTDHQVSEQIAGELQVHEHALYEAKSNWIKKKIGASVVEQEAARRGISRDELIESEVNAQIGVAAKTERLEALVERLKSSHHIRISLSAPVPRQIPVNLSLARLSGPVNALVTIIVFSDFDCRFCASLAPVLEKIRKAFPEQLLVGFRYFPLADHPRAKIAAEAAECAAMQGKFWPYHDELFAHGGNLSDEALRSAAKTAGLDESAFAECLRSHAGLSAVEASSQDAASLGIEGTPSIFLNGRFVGGLLTFDALSKLVRDELAKSREPLKK